MSIAIEQSQQLLKKIRALKPYDQELIAIKELTEKDLLELDSDAKKLVFWVNIYNSFAIHLLKTNPNKLLNAVSRKIHFITRSINIAGNKMSLDNIEHCILRCSTFWWSKGYVKKPRIICTPFEINHRLNKIDYRIHFALNCGGKGCPPIKFFDADKIEQQLNAATESFLTFSSHYNQKTNTVEITKLFDWYYADFGKKKGIFNILKQYNCIPKNVAPKIVYSAYSWKPIAELMLAYNSLKTTSS